MSVKTTSNFIRVGVQLNERQINRLRDITARLGIPQNRLMVAVADCITDEEAISLNERYAHVKAADVAAKMTERFPKQQSDV